MKHLGTYIVIALVGICGLMYFQNIRLQKQVKDGENAQALLSQKDQQIQYYQNRDSLRVGVVKTDEATKENIEIIFKDNKALRDQVGKLSRLQSYLLTQFEAQGKITAPVYYEIRDSVINDTVSHFNFDDGYLKIRCSVSDTAMCDYSYTDNMVAVVYLKPLYKWYQFWKWGKKESITEVFFSNPRSEPKEIKSVLKRVRPGR